MSGGTNDYRCQCRYHWRNALQGHCGRCHGQFASQAAEALHVGPDGECIDPGTLGFRKLAHQREPKRLLWTLHREGQAGYVAVRQAAA